MENGISLKEYKEKLVELKEKVESSENNYYKQIFNSYIKMINAVNCSPDKDIIEKYFVERLESEINNLTSIFITRPYTELINRIKKDVKLLSKKYKHAKDFIKVCYKPPKEIADEVSRMNVINFIVDEFLPSTYKDEMFECFEVLKLDNYWLEKLTDKYLKLSTKVKLVTKNPAYLNNGPQYFNLTNIKPDVEFIIENGSDAFIKKTINKVMMNDRYHCGRTILVYAVNNIEQFINSINYLLENPDGINRDVEQLTYENWKTVNNSYHILNNISVLKSKYTKEEIVNVFRDHSYKFNLTIEQIENIIEEIYNTEIKECGDLTMIEFNKFRQIAYLIIKHIESSSMLCFSNKNYCKYIETEFNTFINVLNILYFKIITKENK